MQTKIEDLAVKREAFEAAYIFSATPEQAKVTKDWLRSWQCKEGYKQTSLQDKFIGFCLGRAGHVAIQEVWELAGGNPGIKATKEELVCALKLLDEVCDEAGDKEDAERAEKDARKVYSPAVNAGERRARAGRMDYVPVSTIKKIKAVGLRLRDFRKTKGITQKELGDRLSVDQTYVSMIERGVITKAGDNGATNLARAEKMLSDAQDLFKPTAAINAAYEVETVVSIARSPEKETGRVLKVDMPKKRMGTDAAFHFDLTATKIGGEEIDSSRYWDEFNLFVKTHHGRFARSAYIRVGPILTYVRAGRCLYYMGARQDAIEISRITVPEEMQGRGLAKHFFNVVTNFAKENNVPYIVVAQVHNENFREQLLAWGFTRYHPPGNDEDFIYIKDVYK